MIRLLPRWLRRWLLRQLEAPELAPGPAPSLAGLRAVRGPAVHLVRSLIEAGHSPGYAAAYTAAVLVEAGAGASHEVLHATAAVWAAAVLAGRERAVPAPAPTPTPTPAPSTLDLEDLGADDDRTGELPLPLGDR